MRVALLSPYSWTYPGGVTRHIEALARSSADAGHEARVLAPFDPDDALSRRLHRGARPSATRRPSGFVSLGRTFGIPANGAVSNMALTPHAVFTLRRELREGGYDVVHIHEPVVPILGWDALCSSGELPLVGTFHTYSENADHQRRHRRWARRTPADEPPARSASPSPRPPPGRPAASTAGAIASCPTA